MTKDEAVNLIWDYMHMGHELKKADIILILGSFDTRTAGYGAQLYLEGWAPLLVISGSGIRHHNSPTQSKLYAKFNGRTEAEYFAEIARNAGVPDEDMLLEREAQNTQENFDFSRTLFEERGINVASAILVQKPFMERRTYATGKIRWPHCELIVTSPPLSYEEYVANIEDVDAFLSVLVGDLQRISVYPELGYQIPQEIPQEVWEAFEYLVSIGYNKHLIP